MKLRTAVLAATLLAAAGSFALLAPARAQTGADSKGEVVSYKIDPVHSSIIFGINHLGVSNFYGRINGPVGEFSFDPDNPAATTFEIKARTKNVDTGNPQRDGHIKSADFFNASQFPEITFKSTAVKKTETGVYRVTGDLSFHGVTKSIDVDMTHVGTNDLPRFGHRCGFSTTFTIKRSDFGITFMSQFLGDDVTLMIGLEGQAK